MTVIKNIAAKINVSLGKTRTQVKLATGAFSFAISVPAITPAPVEGRATRWRSITSADRQRAGPVSLASSIPLASLIQSLGVAATPIAAQAYARCRIAQSSHGAIA